MAEEKKARTFYARGLSNVLSDLLKPMAGADSGFIARIKTDWHLIAGEKVAARVRPIKIVRQPQKKEGAILHLEVEEGFALELQYMEALLIEKIAVYFGYKAVSGIRYKQVEPKKIERLVAAKKISPEEKARLAEITGNIDDEQLKSALEKLGAAVMEKN